MTVPNRIRIFQRTPRHGRDGWGDEYVDNLVVKSGNPYTTRSLDQTTYVEKGML